MEKMEFNFRPESTFLAVGQHFRLELETVEDLKDLAEMEGSPICSRIKLEDFSDWINTLQ